MNVDRPTISFGYAALRSGLRFHYAEAGAAGGEVILFLHGFTDSWYSFSLVLPHLPSSLHSYAPDQRGHGDSERPAAGYTMEDFANDAVAFLDAMGVRRATLVGHSMGSFIAQRIAIDHPTRVARLALVGSAATPVNDGVLGLQESVQVLSDPVPLEYVREFQAGTVYRPVPASFLATVVAESQKLPARVWRDVLAGLLSADTAAALAHVQTPTLIVWGDRDQVFPEPAEQERLRQAIPGATLAVYRETGHAPHWEQPERFAGDLQRFIRSTG